MHLFKLHFCHVIFALMQMFYCCDGFPVQICSQQLCNPRCRRNYFSAVNSRLSGIMERRSSMDNFKKIHNPKIWECPLSVLHWTPESIITDWPCCSSLNSERHFFPAEGNDLYLVVMGRLKKQWNNELESYKRVRSSKSAANYCKALLIHITVTDLIGKN
jgi:hypothetical protein